MDVERELIVSFPDQSEAFTLGVEAGMFWQRIESGEREVSMIAHTTNAELMRRMSKSRGLVLETQATEVEGWVEVRAFVPKMRPRLLLIGGGLK